MIPAQHIYPPFSYIARHGDARPSCFLGGSIEMGEARDWQAEAYLKLRSEFAAIYNPRRPDWDSSWTQSHTDTNFNIQVNWELDRIEHCDLVILHFEPDTRSAITLEELGICSILKPGRTHVFCHPKFWRKGNVDITCQRYRLTSYDSSDALLAGVAVAARALPRRCYDPSVQRG